MLPLLCLFLDAFFCDLKVSWVYLHIISFHCPFGTQCVHFLEKEGSVKSAFPKMLLQFLRLLTTSPLHAACFRRSTHQIIDGMAIDRSSADPPCFVQFLQINRPALRRTGDILPTENANGFTHGAAGLVWFTAHAACLHNFRHNKCLPFYAASARVALEKSSVRMTSPSHSNMTF